MAVNPNPISNSKRSGRRKNRGFISLSVSSRKHRRAARRSGVSRAVFNTTHQQHVGGSLNYH